MVYKVFFDRRELVLAAVSERIGEIADAAALNTPSAETPDSSGTAFTRSFIEVSVHVIESLRNDSELAVLFGEGSPVTLYEALWTSEITERALTFWQPWLDSGRRSRALRDDLSNRDLADWLHTVYASMILRANIPPERERAMIQRFVMTSLAMATAEGPGEQRPLAT